MVLAMLMYVDWPKLIMAERDGYIFQTRHVASPLIFESTVAVAHGRCDKARCTLRMAQDARSAEQSERIPSSVVAHRNCKHP